MVKHPELWSETSPLATYKFEENTTQDSEDILPFVSLPTAGPRGGKPHNQVKNRAARRARRISHLTRNGQHL
jgi:hypothetical protein